MYATQFIVFSKYAISLLQKIIVVGTVNGNLKSTGLVLLSNADKLQGWLWKNLW